MIVPDGSVAPNTTYSIEVVLDGNDVMLYENATLKASHTFGGPQTAGQVGLGTQNAIGQFDNFSVAVLPGSSSSASSIAALLATATATATADGDSSDNAELRSVDLLKEISSS